MNPAMTPEQYQQLIDQGHQGQDLEDAIKMQLAQAQWLRQGNEPQMHNAGATVVAPNAMELIGGLAREGAANKAFKTGVKSYADLRAIQAAQSSAVLRALLGGQDAAPGVNPAQGLQLPNGSDGTGLQPGGSTGPGLRAPSGWGG